MRVLLGTLVIGAVLAAAGGAAGSVCLPTTHVATDQEMLQQVQQFAFVAEGRIGDRGGAATFEMDLGPDTGAPAAAAQYDWPNGIAVPFSVEYQPSGPLVIFTLGSQQLTYVPDVGLGEIFFRTRATETGTSILLDQLALNGDAICGNSQATGDGLDILRLADQNLLLPWTLTGQATLVWTGTPPSQSRLAFQIKVAAPASTPAEAASWGLLKTIYR